MSLFQVEKRITIHGGGGRMSVALEERRVSLSQELSVPIPGGEERVRIPRGEEFS